MYVYVCIHLLYIVCELKQSAHCALSVNHLYERIHTAAESARIIFVKYLQYPIFNNKRVSVIELLVSDAVCGVVNNKITTNTVTEILIQHSMCPLFRILFTDFSFGSVW